MKYEVTVYSSDSCKFCVKLKEWLEDNNIPYNNKDINNERVYNEFEKFEVNGIPFTLLENKINNTEERIVGFQPDKIKENLGM